MKTNQCVVLLMSLQQMLTCNEKFFFEEQKFKVQPMDSNKREIDNLEPVFCEYTAENNSIFTKGSEENSFKIN